MQHHYRVVDVFTQTPLEGNPLAVFPDATGIDAREMQRVARELNLSETTFVLPPDSAKAVAKVRIFTPNRELKFAGHPTLGTAYVLRALGIVPRDATRFSLEEGVGLVPLRVDERDAELLWFTMPPVVRGRSFEPLDCARMLGLEIDELLKGVPPRVYGAANGNLFVPLKDAAAVDRATLDPVAFSRLVAALPETPTCAFVFAPTSTGAYSRMFAPAIGITEDPASGSVTGPLAALMVEYGLVPHTSGTRFTSEQGTKMGRRSFLHVLLSGENGSDAIEIGGHVVPVVSATMTLAG